MTMKGISFTKSQPFGGSPSCDFPIIGPGILRMSISIIKIDANGRLTMDVRAHVQSKQMQSGTIKIVHMGVSKYRGTPRSSILIGFSIVNHPFWGTTIFGNTHIFFKLDGSFYLNSCCDFSPESLQSLSVLRNLGQNASRFLFLCISSLHNSGQFIINP